MITLNFLPDELADSLDGGECQQLAYHCLKDLEPADVVRVLQSFPVLMQRLIFQQWDVGKEIDPPADASEEEEEEEDNVPQG